jgi:acyl-CoA reductase-like NAD-dependent aldehyde dehydrogenase
VPWEERADYLFRTAEALRAAPLRVRGDHGVRGQQELGEADADVAELIDFAEYYAREALRLGGPQPVVPYPGERDEMRYIPLGVGAVIPPWNFPGAIMGGMTMAAIVTRQHRGAQAGGTRRQSSRRSSRDARRRARSARRRAQLRARPRLRDRRPIVDDPRTRFIAFTGSKEVGHAHLRACGEGAPRPDLAEAHDPRDGRQGLDRRRRDGGPGRGRAGHRRRRVRIPGPEVLRVLARDHRRDVYDEVLEKVVEPRRS